MFVTHWTRDLFAGFGRVLLAIIEFETEKWWAGKWEDRK
jgi:hypothetical protein